MTYGQQPGRGTYGRPRPYGSGPGQGGRVPDPGGPAARPNGPAPQPHVASPYPGGGRQPYGAPPARHAPGPYGAPPPPQAPPAPPYGHPAPHGPHGPQGAYPQYPHPQGQHQPQDPRYAGPGAAAAPAARRRREPTPTGGPITDEDEMWSVPAYVGIFVTGFVAPAVVLLLRGRTSRFARFHAVQALNLSIAMTVCNVAAFALMYWIGLTGLLLMLMVLAVEYTFVIKGAIGANRCEWYRLPAIAAWPIVR